MNEHMRNVFFGKIGDYEAALFIAKWSGEAFLGAAVLLAFFSFFTTAWLLAIAAIHALFGYFIRFKLSRTAAVMGLIFAIPCFLLSFLLPGGRGGLVFGIVIWAGVRGVEATFKLPRMAAVQGPQRGA